jgi:hypothetical protein
MGRECEEGEKRSAELAAWMQGCSGERELVGIEGLTVRLGGSWIAQTEGPQAEMEGG